MRSGGQSAGNPAILVYSGTWKFTGPDEAVLNYSLTVYPASPTPMVTASLTKAPKARRFQV